jgi:transposase
MIRRSPAEKREIIDLVEHSALPIGRILAELDVPRSSFSRKDTGTVCRWYQQYQQEGKQGLEPQPSKRRQFWNRLAEPVCDQVIQLALAQPEKSAQQLAWLFTPFGPEGTARRGETADQEGYFVSESGVFRLLKRLDLVHRQPEMDG